jgi:hypothetical protein
MTYVTRKEVERSEPFEKGLDLKSVWRQRFPKKSTVNHLISSDICFRMIQEATAQIDFE